MIVGILNIWFFGHFNSLISIRRKMICLIYEYRKFYIVWNLIHSYHTMCVHACTVQRASNSGHSISNVLFLLGKIQVFDVVRISYLPMHMYGFMFWTSIWFHDVIFSTENQTISFDTIDDMSNVQCPVWYVKIHRSTITELINSFIDKSDKDLR